MARYRIGNRFLSQKEYDEENDWKWICGLFLTGSVFTGFMVNHYLVNPEWYQAIRFLVTVIPAAVVGFILVKFRTYIQIFIGLAIILVFVAVVVGLIASVV